MCPLASSSAFSSLLPASIFRGTTQKCIELKAPSSEMKGGAGRCHTSHPASSHVKPARVSFPYFARPLWLFPRPPSAGSCRVISTREIDSLPSACLKFWINCGSTEKTCLMGKHVSWSMVNCAEAALDQQWSSAPDWGLKVSALERELRSSG